MSRTLRRMPNVLTTIEASQRYGLTTRHLRHLITHGTIRARRSGLVWLIDEQSLQRYLATDRKPGPKPKRRS